MLKGSVRTTLGLLVLSRLAACNVQTDSAAETASTAAAPQALGAASGSATASTREAQLVGDTESAREGRNAAVAKLAAARLLTGTGIEVALPKDAVRVGRGELTFRLSGSQALTFSLAHQSSASSADAALARAVRVFDARKEFEIAGEPYSLSEAPARFAAFGTTPEDVLGNPTADLRGLIASVAEGGHLLFLRASFPTEGREVAEAIAASVKVHPHATLDPLGVHGIVLSIPEGYSLKPNQLHPIVILPKGASAIEGEPALDLRVAGPERTEELFAELLRMFGADLQATACAPAVTVHPDKPSEKYRRQTCKFQSARGEYQVRLDMLEDALGGVVATTTVPDTGAEQHAAAFAKMTEAMRLKQPAKL